MDTTLVQSLYPGYWEDGKRNWHSDFWPSYDDLVETHGTILIETHAGDYQGDSFYLVSNENLYGIIIFGWGSCSGCDALEACSSYEELEELRLSLTPIWRTKDEIIEYITNHDWEGDYCWHIEELQEFLTKVKEYLHVDS